MRLLLKQYLASLKERGELDAILPDFLSESGFTVIYRPKRGVREHGVDVAAIGIDADTKQQTMYLLSIKSGDLTRGEWDDGDQSLRRSLNEILDHYIPKRIAKRYKHLPIKIALCFGGDILGNVRDLVDSYVDNNTQEGKIEFAEWNGDYIVDLIAGGILREGIFPKSIQGDLRKALAFVDEPSICVSHFHRVLAHLEDQHFKTKRDRLTAVRQIYMAVWNIYVWGRDADNLDAAYVCSERAFLWVWDMCKEHIRTNSSVSKALREAINKFSALNNIISSSYIALHVFPHSNEKDGLASSVSSRFSLDINLKLFDVLGRSALRVLWLLYFKHLLSGDENKDARAQLQVEVDQTAVLLYRMIDLNPVLNSPIRDDHVIEITLVGLFLLGADRHQNLPAWIEQIHRACEFEFSQGMHYPCIYRDYAELAVHPQPAEGYKEEATLGSVLYPTLAIWCSLFGNEAALKQLSEYQKGPMSHSTWQIWLPGADTEEHLYKDSARHGASFSDLDLKRGASELRKQLQAEITASDSFQKLSAMRYGPWPLVLMACRHHRLPVPPHFWMINLGGDEQ